MSKVAIENKTDYPTLDREQRRHIGVLKERRKYLANRIRKVPGDTANSYRKSEVEALNWTLGLIEQIYGDSGLLTLCARKEP